MKKISKLLSSNDFKTLEKLIGKSVNLISCNSSYFNLEKQIIESNIFYLSYQDKNLIGNVNRKIFKFKSVLYEVNDIDFYEIFFSISKIMKFTTDNEQFIHQSNCIIGLGKSSVITRIDVLNNFTTEIFDCENIENLELNYDEAILLHLENNKKILFSAQRSITSLSEFIHNEKTIKERIKGLKIRKTIH